MLRELLFKLNGPGGTIAVAEVPGPVGVPDLLALTRGLPGFEGRLGVDCPPLLAWTDARLVSSVPVHRGATWATVVRRSGVGERQAQRRLHYLIRIGALSTEGRLLIRAEGLQPMGRVIALEAKVADWRKAIAQAARYGNWADISAAVMLQLPRDPSPAIEYARRMRVGLAVRDAWLVRPSVYRLSSAVRLSASEHFLAALTCLEATETYQSPSATA